jgi:hypothetical protein
MSNNTLDLREGTSQNAASAVGLEAERSEPLSHMGQPQYWESNVDQTAAWLMNTDAQREFNRQVVQRSAPFVALMCSVYYCHLGTDIPRTPDRLVRPTPHCHHKTTRINPLRSAGP